LTGESPKLEMRSLCVSRSGDLPAILKVVVNTHMALKRETGIERTAFVP
jgi:hypothetical protein